MAIELVSCPACGRKNASDRTTCLSCGADLPSSNATEQKQVAAPWAAALGQRLKKVRLNGWQRLWVGLSVLWFLGWLVGFPLYVRSKDLRDVEFVIQKFFDNPKELAPEEVERLAPAIGRVFQIMFEKDNPLGQELKDEEARFERERSELATQLLPEEPISRFFDRMNEQMRQQLKNSLFKKVLLTAAKEDVTLVNTYKRLLKSNWSGSGLYVFLGPLVAYAGIYGSTLAVRWVLQGFHNSPGT